MDRVCETSKLRKSVAAARNAGKTIGFVPTMGALHEGHLSLIRAARSECGFVVVSIFVNPTQFGPGNDLDKYPRDPEGDCAKLEELGVDLVFTPDVEAMYPPGANTKVVPDPRLVNRLCGLSRPGHFEGVATVVAKLFNMAKPDAAYFGAKDYQQSVVIRRMARDLDFDVEVKVLPTVRESNGLAMSSRNAYLSESGRKRALALPRALKAGEDAIKSGERKSENIRNIMLEVVEAADDVGFDYLEVVDGKTLETMKTVSGRIVLVGAIRVGKTRLIDNMSVEVPE